MPSFYQQQPKLYDLSDVEKFYDYKEQHKQCSGKVYIGVQLIDDYVFDLKVVQNKVLEIMKQNKQLYIQVTATHKVYQLDLDSLDLNDFVYIHDDSAYESINDIELVHFFLEENPKNGHTNVPLWKLVYLPKLKYLVFNFGHTFYDGMSGIIFLKKLLEKLVNSNRIEEEEEEEEIINYKEKFKGEVVDEALLDLDIVDVYPRPSLDLTFCKSICKDYIGNKIIEPTVLYLITLWPRLLSYKFFQSFNRYTCSKIKPKPNLFVDKHKCVNINSENTRKLIKYCKKQGVTLNTLLISLLCTTSPLSYKNHNFISKINIPINMRPRLFPLSDKFQQNVMALAISATQIKSPLISQRIINDRFHFNNFLLEMDSTIKESIQNALDMSVYSIASIYKNNLESLLASKPGLDGELSNLGLFTHELVKDVIFNQGLEPMNFMNISSIGGSQGTRTTFMWYSGSNGEIEKRIQDFEEKLYWIINED